MKERISWETYEFEYKKKTTDWFWAVGIVSAAIAIIASIYGDALFALFILMAGLLSMKLGNNKPQVLEIELKDKGISINEKMYLFQNIKNFWVEDSKHSTPKLLLRVDRFIDPIIVLPIETDEMEPSDIRNHLLNYVVEEKIPEPFAHKIMEYFGF